MEQKEDKKNNFITQVLILFAVDILLLMIFTVIFGKGASEISTIYRLGTKGLAISTMLQFLLSSVVTIAFKSLFFSEKIFKNLMTIWRIVLFLFSILVSFFAFIILFDWFPLNNIYAWIGFTLSFVGCFAVSTAYMVLKTRLDNRKYDELLTLYKKQHEGDDENE